MPVTAAKIGYGTTFKWGDNFVAEITRVGPVSIVASKQDATTLGSPNSYKDILPGLLDPGDVEIEGLFRPDDDAQAALITDMNARTSRTCIIAFPTALSTAIWTFDAYCLGFTAGDATPEGIIPFTATLGIIGKPTLSTTQVAGMTVMTGIEQTATTALVILPSVAVGVYVYSTDAITTGSDWIKLQITAAGVITVTVLGVAHVLTSTFLSEIMTIDVAGEVTEVTIVISETGKASRTYKLYIHRPN